MKAKFIFLFGIIIFGIVFVAATFFPEPWGNDVDAGGFDLNNVGNINGTLIGSMNWTFLQNYPTVCPAGTFVTTLDDSVTCTAPTAADVDPGTFPTGNYIFDGNLTVDTNLLFIDSTSNVIGIGTVVPSSELHIYVDNADTVESFTIEQDGAGDATMQLLLTGGQNFGIGIDSDDGDAFKIDNNGPEFGSAEFQIQANNDVLLVKFGGKVGIGESSPGNLFTVDGSGLFQLQMNTTAMTCNETNAGAIYYDNSTNKHRGCDATVWQNLY